MGFLVSPGVEVKEIDLTNVIPAVSTSIGGFVGDFTKGPINEPVLISSEKELAETFGAPTVRGSRFVTPYLIASSFLKYGNALQVVRAKPNGVKNATSAGDYGSSDTQGTSISTEDEYLTNVSGYADGVIARTPGTWGNSLRVEIYHAENKDDSQNDGFLYNGYFSNEPGTSTFAEARNIYNDEINIIVVDHGGEITGTAGTILEIFEGLSILQDAKKTDGSSNYAVDVIRRSSKYIYLNEKGFQGASSIFRVAEGSSGFLGDSDNSQLFNLLDSSVDATAEIDVFGATAAELKAIIASDFDVTVIRLDTDPDTTLLDLRFTLSGGSDGSAAPTTGDIETALDQLADANVIDISLLFAQGSSTATDNTTIANKLIAICDARKDCLAFISPPTNTTASNTEVQSATAVKTYFQTTANFASTSYAVFDSTPVYVYNKYTDEYVYIPACGHIAGLCARTDDTNDPWFSPAGYNRGQLLQVAKLKINPTQAERDLLYKNRINPIVSFPGQGIVLFGDKTAQAKPSAFDRINVRRLFIVLEKAISTAAKYQLFELNDEFTRAMFRNMTEPFLRDVKGRRGITDFLVVCDETNNTGEVIDSNRFVADIYVKPSRSINFITLNFIATRTGVEFSEIAGGQG